MGTHPDRMRIAIFTDNFYPELSGITDSILSVVARIVRRGHTLRIYAPWYAPRNFRQAKVPAVELALGERVTVSRLPSLPFPGPTNQSRVVVPGMYRLREVKEFAPDVIHTHHVFGVGIEALRAARLFKVPLVGTSHTPLSEFVPPYLGALSWRYINWYYNHCTFLSAPSQSIIDEMKSTGFSKPIEVISNPIKTDAFLPPNPTQKRIAKEFFHLRYPTMLYTGRLAKEKNIDVILRAAALVKQVTEDFHLLITGHGAEKKNLEALVKSLNLTDQVLFTGTVDTTTLITAYQAADLFIIASTAETQSLSLMNAFASGLPAIGVRARALGEYINEQNGLIVEPGDEHMMAEKILILLRNEKKREELGRAGRLLVEQFSEEHIASRWEKIYYTLTHSI